MILNAAERRQFERFPILLDGQISFGDAIVECTILDISAGGAKVRLDDMTVVLDADLVKHVVLTVPEFGGFEGEIVWQDDEYVGVEFFDSHKTTVNLVLEWADRKIAS